MKRIESNKTKSTSRPLETLEYYLYLKLIYSVHLRVFIHLGSRKSNMSHLAKQDWRTWLTCKGCAANLFITVLAAPEEISGTGILMCCTNTEQRCLPPARANSLMRQEKQMQKASQKRGIVPDDL